MRILGLSSFTHDTSAALLEDGNICAVVEEGKLSRAKSTRGLPTAAIQFCLKQASVKWKELDHHRVLRHQDGVPPSRIRNVEHHLSHAASAFFLSPFERSLVVTMDEEGDGRSGMLAVGEGTHIRVLRNIPYPDSLAWLYS